jgi:hypothetical protein
VQPTYRGESRGTTLNRIQCSLGETNITDADCRLPDTSLSLRAIRRGCQLHLMTKLTRSAITCSIWRGKADNNCGFKLNFFEVIWIAPGFDQKVDGRIVGTSLNIKQRYELRWKGRFVIFGKS